MKRILIDTCVVVDMVDQNQERHEIATKLLKLVSKTEFQVEILAHSFFELAAVFKNLHELGKKGKSNPTFNLKTKNIPIDEKFLHTYLDASLPYMKGADFMFLCYAHKEKISFITEDDKLYKKCKSVNIDVYRIQDFLLNNQTHIMDEARGGI